MIMIGDFGKSVKINGRPEQVALELETAARTVREAFVKRLGEGNGNDFFETVIANARLTDSERDAEADALLCRREIENPELVRMAEALLHMKGSMAGFGGRDTLREDKNKICRILLPALQETRALRELEGLEYIPEKECVAASFRDRPSQTVCVACDSGIAMIRDIVWQLK